MLGRFTMMKRIELRRKGEIRMRREGKGSTGGREREREDNEKWKGKKQQRQRTITKRSCHHCASHKEGAVIGSRYVTVLCLQLFALTKGGGGAITFGIPTLSPTDKLLE